MSCSRRNFLTGAGAVIMTTGLAGTAVVSGRSQAYDDVYEDIYEFKKLGMVYDETACIGCTACTDACREVNNVPEGVSRLEITRSEVQGEYPNADYQFDRISCQHCENAPCVYVCPTGAAYKDPSTGIVDVHQDKCVGCGYCLLACPYQVRFFHPETKSADKCNFCRDTNLAEGKLPACVESCPTKALTFGDLNDPNSDVNKVIESKTVYRDKVHLGTKPQLYKVAHEKGEVKS
ncbi:cytochrome c nitrite reductase Fe-S protein [Vibrio sp. SCSIO 43136]|uniref:cytochrome c nitrite reductase Fe-S protein n=1 Tax=Vibrio sp. SCSIO 43136 TaxID=2819101 RepID=UPI002074D400|nr:cytochrome c nitrite reductase Fe-S protein [Vibrio sp. SCSIO 43136]USD66383.1 cytochrome c nitrite reductase Fe-S protein [Vibrio sp. SCSIO 43136]